MAGRDALRGAIAGADIALSVCPGETFGLAVLEALACGTPVVTADRGGARELVDVTSGGWAAPYPTTLAVHADVTGVSGRIRVSAWRETGRLVSWNCRLSTGSP